MFRNELAGAQAGHLPSSAAAQASRLSVLVESLQVSEQATLLFETLRDCLLVDLDGVSSRF